MRHFLLAEDAVALLSALADVTDRLSELGFRRFRG